MLVRLPPTEEPNLDREALSVLRDFTTKSATEIGAERGLSRGQVERLIRKARGELAGIG
jgi:hypothetical protein